MQPVLSNAHSVALAMETQVHGKSKAMRGSLGARGCAVGTDT